MDLLGDDAATVTSPTVSIPQNSAKSNQSLLEEIFGPGPSASAQSPASPATQPQKSSVNDILGLFDSTPAAPAASASPPLVDSSPASLFSPTPATQPKPTPAPQPAAPNTTPKLQSYAAYDKNELRISLTPQTSALRPGVVNILARFQVTGSTPAAGLNFQAAVPKVCSLHALACNIDLKCSVSPNSCRCYPCQAQT